MAHLFFSGGDGVFVFVFVFVVDEPGLLPVFFFFFLGRDEERDRSIAKHVMSVHINASGVNAGAQEGDIDIATMKKFVSYCRLKCAPRLSEAAATMLSSQVGPLLGRKELIGAQITHHRNHIFSMLFLCDSMVLIFLLLCVRALLKAAK